MFARTGGRVLGFAFDAGGNQIAADAVRACCASRRTARSCSSTGSAASRIRYADAVVVATQRAHLLQRRVFFFRPGRVFFFAEGRVFDIIEQSATGRILVVHDPSSGKTSVVAAGCRSPTALSQDQRWLFVAETGRYCIWKIAADARDLDLAGGPSAQASVLLDNLPGYPDNLMARPGRGGSGSA